MSTVKAEVIPIFARPGVKARSKMPKWTEARRIKFMRTVRRKAKEQLQALRQERRKGRKGRQGVTSIARPRARYAGRGGAKGVPRGSIGPHTLPQERRKARAAGEERLDAIAYLRAATEGYEGVPTSVCLSLLALRRLEGQIK